MQNKNTYQWAIIGAGPAGMASVGLLLDMGVAAENIIWIDPEFTVGDFGKLWQEVHSNTSVELFIEFLSQIKAFNYDRNTTDFALNQLPGSGFTQLGLVAIALQQISDNLRTKVPHQKAIVNEISSGVGCWQLHTEDKILHAEKVIVATGATPKSLKHQGCEISIADALSPNKLATQISPDDTVAVFGASHSAMIIIKNILEAGAKHVINFYRSPIKYAIRMENYTLYDNTGLKGETAAWTHKNISRSLHPKITRYLFNQENIAQRLPECNKCVYAIGFERRVPKIETINPDLYDSSCGIIAPGLFGTGIAFPRKITDPNGNQEYNVGLWKFYNDLKLMLPIWQKYHI